MEGIYGDAQYVPFVNINGGVARIITDTVAGLTVDGLFLF